MMIHIHADSKFSVNILCCFLVVVAVVVAAAVAVAAVYVDVIASSSHYIPYSSNQSLFHK